MDLKAKKCAPCEGGVPRLGPEQIAEHLQEIKDWEVREDKLHRAFKLKNFVRAMRFINQVAQVAEEEGHHPDFCVHYNRVDMTICTHAVGGLTENDFILAAKIDALLSSPAS